MRSCDRFEHSLFAMLALDQVDFVLSRTASGERGAKIGVKLVNERRVGRGATRRARGL